MHRSHAPLSGFRIELSLAVALTAILTLTSLSVAGPNAGGTLVVHDANILYSDLANYCGVGTDPVDCGHVDSRIDQNGDTNVVWKIYAAFVPCTSPRLTGVSYGIAYDPYVFVLEAGGCGDHSVESFDWPNSGTGQQVSWAAAQTGWMTEVSWFAGYSYPEPCLFRVQPHPVAGGYFVDDSVPSTVDYVAGYSSLGFNRPGQVVCGGWNYGACCHVDGTCSISGEGNCHAPDVWHPCAECDPYLCWEMDAEDLSPQPELMVRMVPNPLREQARIDFRVAGPAVASVGVFDAAGRELRRLFHGETSTGMRSILWNGCDEAGRSIAAGTYYLRLETAAAGRSMPIVVLR